MSITQQLLLNPQAKIIGFTGGKGRNYLVNEFAEEFGRSGKKVVIGQLGKDLLPTSGRIVYSEKDDELLQKIEKELEETSVVYAGRGVKDHFVSGITAQIASKIINSGKVDYLLLVVGSPEKVSVFSHKHIARLAKMDFLDQLIYCFQIDYIDRELDREVAENPEEFLKNFPDFESSRVFDQQLIVRYLTDAEQGALSLFTQQWPGILVFTDVNNPLLENRSINLARDLFIHKIENIYFANLRNNLIKKVSVR